MIGEVAYNNYAFSRCTSDSDSGMIWGMNVRAFASQVLQTRLWTGDWRRQDGGRVGEQEQAGRLFNWKRKNTGGSLLREDATKAKLPAPLRQGGSVQKHAFCETKPFVMCENVTGRCWI